MLLRVSGKVHGASCDLDLVNGRATNDGGVTHGLLLARFAEAVVGGSESELDEARQILEERAGTAILVEAAATIAIFCSNVRVADATGIPLDETSAEPRERVAERFGIEPYSES